MHIRHALIPLVGLIWLLAAAPLGLAETERVSVASDGTQADDFSNSPSLSADGRYVAFVSYASNLAAGCTWHDHRVYVHDRVAGKTECVSVSSDGTPGNSPSTHPSISADGRYVAFESSATNLVPGDMNEAVDVFVHDRVNGRTWCISLSPYGLVGNGLSWQPSISTNGRYVAFCSAATNLAAPVSGRLNIYVRDLPAGQTRLVTTSWRGGPADGDSYAPAISANGRFVAFQSGATNLVPGGSTRGGVFVRDLLTRRTERVSVSWDGRDAAGEGASISDDGRYVAFRGFGHDFLSGETAYGGIFVRDRLARTTILASRGWSADQTPRGGLIARISGNGRYVVSMESNYDYVHDTSYGYWHVFIRDLKLNRTSRVDVASDGSPANNDSGDQGSLGISADGRYLAFSSQATNLVIGDTNDSIDVFVRDRQSFTDVPVEHWAYYEVQACLNGGVTSAYPDGSYQPQLPITRAQMAVFISRALAGGDGEVPAGPPTGSFTDVTPSHWAYRYIEYAKERGIVQGYGNSYRPDELVTRAQLAVFVARALAGGDASVPPGPARPSYPDVPSSYWAYKYVEYCTSQGVGFGLSDGLYHPENPSARDEMAVYLQRAFDLPM